VQTAKKASGIVVGILDEKGTRFVAAGESSATRKQAPDGDTVFEIGSITKAFTGILLADMALRGEVKLEDPVSKYLPETVKVPEFEGRAITLLDLTTQSSALPRLPANLKPKNMMNPYADYSVEQLYAELANIKLTRAPGEKYDYSNLGVGLLGHALARRAGMSYEALVTARILKPLGMSRSSIVLTEDQKLNFASGHGADLNETDSWTWESPTLAGAGAMRSTAKDMLKFLAANAGLTETPLRKAMEMSHEIRKATGTPELSIAMGWHVFDRFQTRIVWHNGGTGGYRTWAGFAPGKKTAVVVLCNTSFGVDDIGLHAIEGAWPAQTLGAPKKEVSVSADVMRGYVGKYELAPQAIMTVTEEKGSL